MGLCGDKLQPELSEVCQDLWCKAGQDFTSKTASKTSRSVSKRRLHHKRGPQARGPSHLLTSAEATRWCRQDASGFLRKVLANPIHGQNCGRRHLTAIKVALNGPGVEQPILCSYVVFKLNKQPLRGFPSKLLYTLNTRMDSSLLIENSGSLHPIAVRLVVFVPVLHEQAGARYCAADLCSVSVNASKCRLV